MIRAIPPELHIAIEPWRLLGATFSYPRPADSAESSFGRYDCRADMKTPPTKATTRPADQLKRAQAASIGALLVALSLFIATSTLVLAVDAVWLPVPASGDWNTGTNWSTSPVAPVDPGDTATFNTSTVTSLTLLGNATVESITFNPGASAFTIDTNLNALTIQGAGIVNNSANAQTITNGGGPAVNARGVTVFVNNASAGRATITNNGNAASGSDHGGITRFFGTSNAANATITDNGSAVAGGNGGFTQFLNSSSAGAATITNNANCSASASILSARSADPTAVQTFR